MRDKWFKIAQITKGGQLYEKICFSKKFSDLDHRRLIFSDFPHWFQKHIYYWILTQARPFLPLSTVHVACTEWKWGVHDAKNTDIYVFGISEKNLKKWAYFGPNLRTFLKKIFFHPRVPPLCFEPFWTICPARFRKWQGVNLKIGISSFHRSFSFCYKQIAW